MRVFPVLTKLVDKMSGSDVSSPEVVRDDGSRSNLMFAASREDLPSLPVPSLDRNDNKVLDDFTSYDVGDEISTAIANASFIIPELKGGSLESFHTVLAFRMGRFNSRMAHPYVGKLFFDRGGS